MNSYSCPAVTLPELCRCAWHEVMRRYVQTEVAVCGCTLEFVQWVCWTVRFLLLETWQVTELELCWGFFCWLFYCHVFSVLLQIYSRSIKHTFLPKLIIFYTFVPDSQLCCRTVIRKRVEQFPLVPHKHDVCVCVFVENKPPLSSFSLKSGHCCFLELHGPDATVLLSSPGDLIRFGSCHVSGCAWFVFLFLNFCIK